MGLQPNIRNSRAYTGQRERRSWHLHRHAIDLELWHLRTNQHMVGREYHHHPISDPPVTDDPLDLQPCIIQK
jgi:hypothetical protein